MSRPTWLTSRAPSTISTHGKIGIAKFGAPSPRACSGQLGPAAILDAPATRNATPIVTEATVATQFTKSDDDRLAFAGREHIDPQRATALDCPACQIIEHVIVVSRVMVKKRESLDPRLACQPDRKVGSAVAPVTPLLELLRCVLRIVNQQIRVPAKIENTLSSRE